MMTMVILDTNSFLIWASNILSQWFALAAIITIHHLPCAAKKVIEIAIKPLDNIQKKLL